MIVSRLRILFLIYFLTLSAVYSQSTYNVKLMTWNLLNYPDYSNVAADTTLRNPYYRTVVQYINPDILVTQENALTTSVSLFLNGVMNAATPGVYSAGSYISGYDTNNGIFYRTADFQFISNTRIFTDLRDINEFKLVHILTGDTIRIYSCHLKASTGTANEAQRALEVDSLRKVTNSLPSGTDFIICGEFNIYSSFESAYAKLIADNLNDDGNFVDSYTMPGIWNQPVYSPIHTQSSRLTSFGGGASGGLNDRFDMVLYSSAVSQPGKISYVTNSTIPIGNDGNHYNLSINAMPNIAVPLNVANALYNASDHLPVTAMFEFSSSTSISEFYENNSSIHIFPNPVSEAFYIQFYLSHPAEVSISIYNIQESIVKEFSFTQNKNGFVTKEMKVDDKLQPGIYFVKVSTGDTFFVTRFLVISLF